MNHNFLGQPEREYHRLLHVDFQEQKKIGDSSYKIAGIKQSQMSLPVTADESAAYGHNTRPTRISPPLLATFIQEDSDNEPMCYWYASDCCTQSILIKTM